MINNILWENVNDRLLVLFATMFLGLVGCVEYETSELPTVWTAKKNNTSEFQTASASSSQEIGILPVCRGDWKNEKEFLKGVTKGRRVAEKAWSKYSNCHLVDEFTDGLFDDLGEIELKKADSYKIAKRCNYMGQIEGVFAVLSEVEGGCELTCLAGGQVVGNLAAKAYCDLLIATNGDVEVEEWVRGSINMCGLMFEFECDFTFIEETTSYENSTGSCEPYTVGEHFDSWELWRAKSCDYPDEI